MKKALLDGALVRDVTDKEFPVAAPLYWVDAPDEVQPMWTREASGAFASPAPREPNPEEAAKEERRASFESDPPCAEVLDRLRAATPAQIDAYVDAQLDTVNLTKIRSLLKKILKAQAALAR